MDPGGLDHRREAGTPAIDQAGFRRGAAHVEGEDLVASGERTVERSRQSTRRRSRLQQPDRPCDCVRGGGNAAGREHDVEVQVPRHPCAVQCVCQPADGATDPALDVRVGDCRREALVLADQRRDPRRERDVEVRERRRNGRRRLLLVGGHQVAMQEADCDRLGAALDQRPDRGDDLRWVERTELPAVASHPLIDLDPQFARDQRLGRRREEIVDVVHLLTAEGEQVAETGRRQEGGRRARALDHSVGDQRRGVDDERQLLRPQAAVGHQVPPPGERRRGRVHRVGQRLVLRDDLPGSEIDEREVGEGPADVEAQREPGAAVIGRSLPQVPTPPSTNSCPSWPVPSAGVLGFVVHAAANAMNCPS